MAHPEGLRQDSPTVERPRILDRDTSTFNPTYRLSDVLNEKELGKETSAIRLALMQARDEVPQWLFQGKDVTEWNNLSDKVDRLLTFQQSLNATMQEKVSQSGTTQGEISFHNALSAGVSLLIRNLLTQQDSIAIRNGLGEKMKPFLSLQSFDVNGEATVHIKGITIGDLRENISVSAAYQFILESLLIQHKRSHAKILDENPDYPNHTYPNIAKNNIELVSYLMTGLINCSDRDFDQFISRTQGIMPIEAAKTAKGLVHRIRRLRHEIHETLIGKNPEDFSLLKDAIEYSLRQGDPEKTLSLFIIGEQETDQSRKLYRIARKKALDNDNIDIDFYTFLADSIRNHIEEAFIGDDRMLTIDDLPTIFRYDEKMTQEQASVTFAGLNKVISLIFSYSSEKEYQVNPQEIQWNNVVEPQSVSVKFDQDRPTKFDIHLSYRNNDGESLDLKLSYDAKKELFEWSFIETPEETPETNRFYHELQPLVRQMLLKICELSKVQYERKQLGKHLAPMPLPLPKRDKPISANGRHDGSSRHGRHRRVLTPIQEVLGQSIGTDLEIETTKNQIILPSKKELARILRGLSSEDKQNVTEAISEYNSANKGKFKRLKNRNADGKPLFALRVKSLSRGGIRILLSIADNQEDGIHIRSLKIEDAGYRRDIFRRNGLKV